MRPRYALPIIPAALLLVILSLLDFSPAQATPIAGRFEDFTYSSGTNIARWNLRLTNDSNAVVNATFGFGMPDASLMTTTPAGACPGIPAQTPVLCSIPSNSALLLSFNRGLSDVCTPQLVRLGPDVLSGGGSTAVTVPASTTSLVAGVQVPNLIARATGCSVPVTYDATTQSASWQVSLPATNGLQTVQADFEGSTYFSNCVFLTGTPCVGGTAQPTFIVATSIPGICGPLPRVVDVTPNECFVPANSPASTVTLSVQLAQTCQSYIFTRSRYAYVFAGATTIEPEQFASVPPNTALCPAVVNPLAQTPPTTPTATATVQPGATPAATATPVPVVPIPPVIVPQVFQNPAVQGIFAGPRNPIATPRPAMAPQMDPPALPVLRPPSTGDGGLE